MALRFLPGLTGPLPDELVVVRHENDEYALDVVALTSNWQCIYGRGCQGVTPFEPNRPELHHPADRSVGGCCRVTPHYAVATAEVAEAGEAQHEALDSPLRVKPYVEALGPDDAQHYDEIAAGRWYVEELDQDGDWESRNVAVGGNCIFLNTEVPEGKLGCALYHLAERLGVDPKHTRPVICHLEPAMAFVIADDLDNNGRRILVTLRPPWFGWFEPRGYWCTADPAAHSASEPVFRRMSSEFSALLGESVYAALLPALEEIWAERSKRLKQRWGQPTALPWPSWAR